MFYGQYLGKAINLYFRGDRGGEGGRKDQGRQLDKGERNGVPVGAGGQTKK